MHVDFVEEVADLCVGSAAVEVGNEGLFVFACLRIIRSIIAVLIFLATEQPSQPLGTRFLLLFPTNLSLSLFFLERFLPLGLV